MSSVVHATYDAAQVSSKRARNATQLAALGERGRRAVVLELQSDLVLASTEIVIREAKHSTVEADYLILHFARVGLIGEGEPADSLFFILAGEVSVSVPLA